MFHALFSRDTTAPRRRPAGLGLELLEGRDVPSAATAYLGAVPAAPKLATVGAFGAVPAAAPANPVVGTASAANADYKLVATAVRGPGPGWDNVKVYASVYTRAGQLVRKDVLLSAGSAGNADQVTVGVTTTGAFVVAWHHTGPGGYDQIRFRLLSPTGLPAGGGAASAPKSDHQAKAAPRVGAGSFGTFTIGWSNTSAGGRWAAEFTPNGLVSRPEYRVL